MRKGSRRLRRMERHQGRRRPAALYLVSMMDIFTILVFFLLVNSTDVQDVPAARQLRLPESVAEQKPRETVIVMVTREDILVQGNTVARVDEVQAAADLVIQPLKRALEDVAGRALVAVKDSSGSLGEVTVMGDRTIPYEVLKKVMATCTDAGYGQVSLAVLQKAVREG